VVGQSVKLALLVRKSPWWKGFVTAMSLLWNERLKE